MSVVAYLSKRNGRVWIEGARTSADDKKVMLPDRAYRSMSRRQWEYEELQRDLEDLIDDNEG